MALAELSSGERSDPCIRTTIECGNKSLTLAVNTDSGRATTQISTISGVTKVLGSTTCVYKEARGLMQAAADETGKPIRYEFSTLPAFSPAMMKWALDQKKGRGVFEWDIVRKPCLLAPWFIAIKTFYPQEATS